MVDPPDRGGLVEVYPQAQWPPVELSSAALLLIDLQRLCASTESGMFARAAELGIKDRMEPYGDRLREQVFPNAQRLLSVFRGAGAPVVYTRIESSTPDGSDRGGCHVRLGLHVPPGHPDGRIVPEVAPEDGDIIVSKTTSDAFIRTGLEALLRDRGVEQLVVCGVLTNECVSSSVRHAADIGFTVSLVEDACAGVEQDLHDATIRTLGRTYARIVATTELQRELAGS